MLARGRSGVAGEAELSTHRRFGDGYVPPLPTSTSLGTGNGSGELPGRHLLIGMHDAGALDDVRGIEAAFLSAINAAGATLLHMHFHVFTPGGGVTGTASLAESHMSIHTWPEAGFAALDIFMCGLCDPRRSMQSILNLHRPRIIDIRYVVRGAGAGVLALEA